jgi:hypothetical protein
MDFDTRVCWRGTRLVRDHLGATPKLAPGVFRNIVSNPSRESNRITRPLGGAPGHRRPSSLWLISRFSMSMILSEAMRLLYNSILIIVGLLLLGSSFLLIGHFHPSSDQEFVWPSHAYASGLWLLSVTIFAFVYVKRTQWLKVVGIFETWHNFKAYLVERHQCPSVSERERQFFLSWSSLPQKRSPRYHHLARELYMRARSEFSVRRISRTEYESLIRCLAWYMKDWPVHEDEEDLQENS